MKKIVLTLVLAGSMVLSGCAAIINGTTQQAVVTTNVDNASIFLNDEVVGKGNAIITLVKKENYVLSAKKEGCKEAKLIPSKSFDPTTLLGLLIDAGLISVLIVDGAATGAWNKFDQSTYFLNLDCNS